MGLTDIPKYFFVFVHFANIAKAFLFILVIVIVI